MPICVECGASATATIPAKNAFVKQFPKGKPKDISPRRSLPQKSVLQPRICSKNHSFLRFYFHKKAREQLQKEIAPLRYKRCIKTAYFSAAGRLLSALGRRLLQADLPPPARQLHIVLIQNPKAVDIPGFPRLFPAAEMQYRRVLHNPLHIINAAAAQQIAAGIAGIIVPYRILQRQCFFSVQGIEDILLRKNSLSSPIHQQNTGIIIVVLCFQPHLIDTVRQLGFAGMGSRRVGSAACALLQSLSLKIQKPPGALSFRRVFQAATAVYTAVMQ